MKTATRSIATGAGIVVAAMSVFAAATSMRADTGGSARSKPTTSTQATSQPRVDMANVRVASSSGSDVSIGPDPFRLPFRKPHEPVPTPFRKRFDTDTIFLGRYPLNRGENILPHHPIRSTYPAIRMTGFLIGNGVYSVLQTPGDTVVVNPGDRIDDGRIVTEIRPNATRLRGQDNAAYTASLHP